MGTMFDWEREIISPTPNITSGRNGSSSSSSRPGWPTARCLRWTSCPKDNTTLAREQVIGEDRHCERCGTPVIKKDLEQWFFQTTKYADELLNFDGIDWPERVKTLQTNWIDRSEGASVIFKHRKAGRRRSRSSPPARTRSGARPSWSSRPSIRWWTRSPRPNRRPRSDAYKVQAARQSDIERDAADKEKTGVFTGAYAINPVNGERIPIWIADYVLMSYGTGAIMAVPAHDERDFAFARKYGLPIIPVIQPEDAAASGRRHDGGRLYRRWRHGQLRPVQRHHASTPKKARKNPGISAVIGLAGAAGHRQGVGQLPLPRLADHPPALLGRAHPDDLSARSMAGTLSPTINCPCCCPRTWSGSRPANAR